MDFHEITVKIKNNSTVCLLCSNLSEKLGELIFIVIAVNLGMLGFIVKDKKPSCH